MKISVWPLTCTALLAFAVVSLFGASAHADGEAKPLTRRKARLDKEGPNRSIARTRPHLLRCGGA